MRECVWGGGEINDIEYSSVTQWIYVRMILNFLRLFVKFTKVLMNNDSKEHLY